MPSQKRQRHRDARTSKQAAEAAAAAASRRKRSGVTVAVVSIAVAALVFVVTRGGGDPEAAKAKAPSEATTTTGATSTPTTADPASATETTIAGASLGADAPCPPANGSAPRTTSFVSAPKMCIDPSKTYSAEVKTSKGSFTMALDPKAAPNTVNNFVTLARYRYYDGVTFHRIIPDFVIQGGDPKGDGTGGPGYKFADELPAAGAYKLGSIVMANSGPDTNGSQFFVITGPNGVSLPPKYALFGQVTAGMETVKAIEAVGSAEGKPTSTVTITSVTITEG